MSKRILVIPEYNEAKTIASVLERARSHVDLIIVVDDGSTDESNRLVREWATQHKRETALITLPVNQGMSGALLAGFVFVARLYQEGLFGPDDLVINIDADGQHRPEEIPEAIISLHQSGADVLLGKRDLSGYPWFKLVGNWGLSLWASLLTGYRYHDVECGFRLMKVNVLADVLPYFTGKRYGCAQELGIITAKRHWKINNRFPTTVIYYRPGARVRDGVTNLVMGGLAFFRVVFGIKTTHRNLDSAFQRFSAPV